MALNSNDLHLLQIFVMAGFFVAAFVGFVLALKRSVWARHPLFFKANDVPFAKCWFKSVTDNLKLCNLKT